MVPLYPRVRLAGVGWVGRIPFARRSQGRWPCSCPVHAVDRSAAIPRRMTGQPSWPILGRALAGYSPASLFKPRIHPPHSLPLLRQPSVQRWHILNIKYVISALPAPARAHGLPGKIPGSRSRASPPSAVDSKAAFLNIPYRFIFGFISVVRIPSIHLRFISGMLYIRILRILRILFPRLLVKYG